MTAAQSAFAVVILSRLGISVRDAAILLGLFAIQLIFPSSVGRYAFSAIYVGAAIWLVVRSEKRRAFITRVPANLLKALH